MTISSQQVVFRKLNASAAVMEEMTGVRIVRVIKKLCAGLPPDCPQRFCQETVTLESAAMATYSTARLSFVTPRHQRQATCLCEGMNAASTHKHIHTQTHTLLRPSHTLTCPVYSMCTYNL